MIKITSYNEEKKEYEEQVIETVLDGIVWSGAKDQGPRSLSFQFLYNPRKIYKQKENEYGIPDYKADINDKVVWEDNGKILFIGYIEKLSYNTDNDTISVECKDFMARLARNKAIDRFKGTLNQISNKICGLFELKNGININNSIIHNIVSNGDLTYLNILEKMRKVSLKKDFNLYLDRNILKLADETIYGTFEIGNNIRNSEFELDMSDMVNKVVVINNEGQIIKTVVDQELINKYGVFQETCNYNEKDNNINLENIEKTMKSPKRKAKIRCENDNNCISGRYIKVIEKVNKFEGIFEIQTDTHIIGIDGYMELEIKEVKDL